MTDNEKLEKMMRVSTTIVDGLDALSKKHQVSRKLLLSAAFILLRCVLEEKAESVDIVREDGTKKNIPNPFVFFKGEKI